MEKHNKEKVVKDFEKKGYVVLGEYESFHKPLILEKNGYKCTLSYKSLKGGCNPAIFGVKCIFWKENIQKYLHDRDHNIQFIDADSYRKSGKTRTIVTMKCKCGKVFKKTWEHIYSDNEHLLCKECAMKIGRESRKKESDKRYRDNVQKRGFILVNKKQQLRPNTYVEVIENSTGYRGFIYPNNNRQMIIFSFLVNKKNYLYNMNIYAKNHGIASVAVGFNNKGKYGKNTIVMKCCCGEYFETNDRGFCHSGDVCPQCSSVRSSYERKVISFLESQNIEYISEFIINSCKDIRPLPFDFQLPNYNCLIEVDGEQHFQPVAFGNMTQEQAEIAFDSCVKHDNIKNEYCEKYNIPLLRIKYTDIQNNNYKKQIMDFIQTA